MKDYVFSVSGEVVDLARVDGAGDRVFWVNDYQLHVVSTAMLIRAGGSYRGVSRACRLGLITRLRQGWYRVNCPAGQLLEVFPGMLDGRCLSGSTVFRLDVGDQFAVRYDLVRRLMVEAAVVTGGTLGGLAAAYVYGIWHGPRPDVEVMVGEGVLAKRRSGFVYDKGFSIRVGRVHHVDDCQQKLAVVGVVDCLKQVIRFHDPKVAACCIEAAVAKGLISPGLGLRLARSASLRKWRAGLKHVKVGADSCSESMLHLLFDQTQYDYQMQYQIPGLPGYRDIRVGNTILEADSQAHHGGVKQVHKDCVRDQDAIRAGFFVIRLSWEQIWLHWDETKKYVLAQIRKNKRKKLRPDPQYLQQLNQHQTQQNPPWPNPPWNT